MIAGNKQKQQILFQIACSENLKSLGKCLHNEDTRKDGGWCLLQDGKRLLG